MLSLGYIYLVWCNTAVLPMSDPLWTFLDHVFYIPIAIYSIPDPMCISDPFNITPGHVYTIPDPVYYTNSWSCVFYSWSCLHFSWSCVYHLSSLYTIPDPVDIHPEQKNIIPDLGYIIHDLMYPFPDPVYIIPDPTYIYFSQFCVNNFWYATVYYILYPVYINPDPTYLPADLLSSTLLTAQQEIFLILWLKWWQQLLTKLCYLVVPRLVFVRNNPALLGHQHSFIFHQPRI